MQFRLSYICTVVGHIMVGGALICCALLHSVCDLKAAQMNVQCSLIWELILHHMYVQKHAPTKTPVFFLNST